MTAFLKGSGVEVRLLLYRCSLWWKVLIVLTYSLLVIGRPVEISGQREFPFYFIFFTAQQCLDPQWVSQKKKHILPVWWDKTACLRSKEEVGVVGCWGAGCGELVSASSPSSLRAAPLACLQWVHDLNAPLQKTIYEFLILFPMVIFSSLHSESSLIKRNKDVTVNYTVFQTVQKFSFVCREAGWWFW